MNSIQGAMPAAAPQSRQATLKNAGEEFEAVLLNNVLGGLEKTFTRLPGASEGAYSTEAYSGFAMEALATGLAQSGGIGIGRLITKALTAYADKPPAK